ncbi:MAG: methyltransferase domain-containing protein [Chloroflexi bacterium]|nr:methyltransferase domain-containing protein [Chloroflexota bacterium]
MSTDRDATGTWHYGLIARWWAEFNEPDPIEVEYLVSAIRRYGEPALDLGCGNGRVLLPLLEAGLDVDGVDVSEDMIDLARTAADGAGFKPMLLVQAKQDLDLDRRFQTIFMVGVFEIGGTRAWDREGLRRVFEHLLPGGTLLINHELPYSGLESDRWARWLPTRPVQFPEPWREPGDRRRLADGDELELVARRISFDPLGQRETLEMRARLWHNGAVVREETARLDENLYFAQEIVALLETTGFEGIEVQSGYSGSPAGPDDPIVMFVAHRPH